LSNSPGKLRQTLLLIDFEVRKLFRQKYAYIGVAVILLLTVLCSVGVYLHRTRAEAKGRNFEGRMIAELINAVTFAETLLLPGVYMLLPMVVAIFAAGSFAGEIQSGLVRTVAVRPVSRWMILVAKLTALSVYSYFLLLALLLVSLGLGTALFGFSGDVITADPQLWGSPKALFIMSGDIAWQRMLLSYFFAGYSMISICAMALMFSAILKRSTIAAVVPLGVYYTSHILGWLPLLESIQRFLPTRYLMVWKYFLAPEIPWADILHDGAFLAVYTLAYLLVAGTVFSTADL
jgi:ABC-2 type transport system permease protein